ncbi:hypothetical protein [Rhodococcus tukisamuensis]|uniref:Secreted protein n=1 Tax=Rhodococcus tukisamuensis TaxID=168276 RepID=A0A1G7BN61_9NOCA|nr:hypothetical protein [Rhodococcus tukisamuensis]SDE27876.1 hypothetical protein SAMN05444580_11394 [Rhodococcus tukisamuensis]
MRPAAIHRSFVARAAASVAVVALPLCSTAAAAANPPPVPAATTTVFQVPVRFVTGCSLELLECWGLPPVTTVSPSATTGVLGVVTFATERAANWAYCVDMTVNWRNLNTGAAGTTALRIVERDYTRDPAPEDWCRYAPATAVTGSGTVAAIADVGAIAPYGMYGGCQVPVNPGLGTFQVP